MTNVSTETPQGSTAPLTLIKLLSTPSLFNICWRGLEAVEQSAPPSRDCMVTVVVVMVLVVVVVVVTTC